MIDREALRVRLLDVLAVFGPRRAFEEDRRVDYWVDRLMEADRPGDPDVVAERAEVERLRQRVAELEVAFDLLKDVEREAEAGLDEVEHVLHDRLQRDAHVVAVEAERDELRSLLAFARGAAVDYAQGRPVQEVLDELLAHLLGDKAETAILDTPSTSIVDSE